MTHRLKKRLPPLILALALLFCAAGCAAPGVAPEKAYPYEHALNVIDDNCRNYYEIFVASFYDGDGDGMGDFSGLAQKLDYLNDGDDATDADLGVNGIWLMPVMPSPSYHKYDTVDFCAVDHDYGTLAEFQALLEACHARGIRLIIDLMLNHTSARHPWFLQAVEYYQTLAPGEQPDYAACPYAGYYHFSAERAGAMGWHRAGESNWYYEGKFWDQMPDLALENALVRAELEHAAAFWLALGVDGFRLDAVKEYVSGSPKANAEVLAWFNDYVLSVNPAAYVVGEAWETNFVGLAPYYESGVASFFNFPLAQATGAVAAAVRRGDGEALARLLVQSAETYGVIRPDFIDAPFLSNHDTTRLSAQYANDLRRMKLAAGLLLTMNGSPFIYYGEELGMNSLGDKDENKRLPMRWSDADTDGTPLPPAGADEVTQKFPALDEQADDPLSLFNYYRRALRIRNENPEIARGSITAVPALSAGPVAAVEKSAGDGALLLLYNIGSEDVQLSLNGTAYEAYALYGYLAVDDAPVTLDKAMLTLPSYAIAVLRR